MPKTILLEELHLTVTAPTGLPKRRCAAIVRTLRGKPFRSRLFDAAREILARYPSLKQTHFSIDL